MKYLIVLCLAAVALAADVPEDSPEVAAAKVAFTARYNAEAARNALGYPYAAYPYGAYPYAGYPFGAYPYAAYPYSYLGYPYAGATVLPSGYLADTPEVAAAKVAFAADYAKAAAEAAAAP